MKVLSKFFVKHKPEFGVMTAMKMADKSIDLAIDSLKKNKDDETNTDHLKYLAKAYDMIEDIFDELEVTPSDFLGM